MCEFFLYVGANAVRMCRQCSYLAVIYKLKKATNSRIAALQSQLVGFLTSVLTSGRLFDICSGIHV